jgi:hypothetical protein
MDYNPFTIGMNPQKMSSPGGTGRAPVAQKVQWMILHHPFPPEFLSHFQIDPKKSLTLLHLMVLSHLMKYHIESYYIKLYPHFL